MFQIGTMIIHSGKDCEVPMGDNIARFYRVALPTGRGDLEMARWLESIKVDAVVCSGSRKKCHNVGRLMDSASSLMRVSSKSGTPTLVFALATSFCVNLLVPKSLEQIVCRAEFGI